MMTTRNQLEIIAGTPPNGGQDRAARALAAAIEEASGIRARVTNIPGRGGGNAWDALLERSGDEFVLAITSPTLITNRLMGVSDIGAEAMLNLATLYTESISLAVPVDSSVEDADGLIERLVDPAGIVVAFATERGNINHLVLARLAEHSGSDPKDLTLRVFDSARHAVADALSGNSEVVAVSAASIVPEVAYGRLRPLATTAPRRLGGPLANVPTWLESGVDCTLGTWRGVAAPPALPPGTLDHLLQLVLAATGTSTWAASLREHLWSATLSTGADLEEFLTYQMQSMTGLLSDLGLVGR